jgi:hypothetical protein
MTAEEQAVVLVNEVRAEREQELWKGVGDRRGYGIVLEALCRAIERHEAYKQEVSDAVKYALDTTPDAVDFRRFIIPKPKPDPLVDVAESLGYFNTAAQGWAGDVRAALEARGLEIREKGQ